MALVRSHESRRVSSEASDVRATGYYSFWFDGVHDGHRRLVVRLCFLRSCCWAPLFPGDSGVDQLVEIIKVLGTPSRDDIREMNASYTEFKFPQISAHAWAKVFRSRTPAEAVDCVATFLAYAPVKRVKPLNALAHGFFDELKVAGARCDENGGGPRAAAALRLHAAGTRGVPGPRGPAASTGSRRGSAILTLLTARPRVHDPLLAEH